VIIGNKADLTSEREVLRDEAQAYCLANNFLWLETSSKELDTVKLAFDVFIGHVYHEVVKTREEEGREDLQRRLSEPEQLSRRASFDASLSGFIGKVGSLAGSVLDFVEEAIEGEIEEEEVERPVASFLAFTCQDTEGGHRMGRQSMDEEEGREEKSFLSIRNSMPLHRAKSMTRF
jgi:hypothetical protein